MKARVVFSLLAAVIAVLTGPTLTSVSAQPAGNAAPLACQQRSHQALDTYNNGGVTGSSAPVRSQGPNAGCTIDGYIGAGIRLHYHCYVVNSAGNTWTWVRVVGESIAGWVYDGNLLPKPGQSVGGSTVPCP